jgi:ribosome maturation factor RimP
MRQAPETLQALVQPAIEALGFELVGIEYLPQGGYSLLRIYIDSEAGINIDDCERVSHQVSGLLDVEDVIHGHYNLEVSSPGLDRPLFTEDHFSRFIGQQVKIRLSVPLNGRRKFTGIIRGMSDGNVELEFDSERVYLPFNTIDKANLVPDI